MSLYVADEFFRLTYSRLHKVAEQAEISSPGSSSQPKVTGGLLPEKFHYVRQRNAPEHLRVVSWPPGKKLANLGGYLYDIDWRIKPTVYIIDSGLDSTSTVSFCCLCWPCYHTAKLTFSGLYTGHS